MKKVSIIVPAYNCEKTLAACLGNLVHQTIDDYEIIIVNDASTDNTMQIILDCEAQFPELIIAVNSDKNRGAGGARNIGLSYASGEYIGFVDSDDIVDIHMFEKLYNTAVSGNCDIVDCGYYDEAKDIAIVHTADELTGTLNSAKRKELIVSGGYIVTKVFRRDFLLTSGISFRENVILEDSEYLLYLLATAKNIANIKEVFYRYRNFDTSSSKYVNATKYFKNATAAMTAIYDKLSSLPYYSELQEAVEYPIFQLASYCVNLCLAYGRQEAGFDEKSSLIKIKKMVYDYVKIPYKSNKYIMNKIEKNDLEIMKKFNII